MGQNIESNIQIGKVITEPKEFRIVKKKMISSKIKTRHWFLLILLAVALVLVLIGLALSMGEQYHVVAEEFRLVFNLSMIIFAVLLIIGIIYFDRWRRRQWRK